MKRAAALLLALLLLASAGCAAPKTLRQQTIFAMNTVMDLRIYASDDSLLQEMTRLLSELDHELSATEAGSALYALNQTGQAENADLAQIVSRAILPNQCQCGPRRLQSGSVRQYPQKQPPDPWHPLP